MIHLREGRDTTPRLDFTHDRPEDWRDQALCAQIGPLDEYWMPTKGKPARRGTKICARCPVIEECLEYALSHPQALEGVWGGTSERQRRVMRRQRREAGAA